MTDLATARARYRGGVSVRWVTAFLDLPASSYGEGVRFWTAATGTTLSPPRGPFATLLPAAGDAWLRVQRVDDGPGGVHLDLHSEDVVSLAWRAVSLGAKEVTREDRIVMLTSPGGLSFCVVGWDGEADRGPVDPGVVDQVCLDLDPGDFETEAAFWSDLTGWPLAQGSRSEFVVLQRPVGQPIRLLLQRREDPSGPATAHLDLAAGDSLLSVVKAHEALGARVLREGASWLTLRDPAGREYCLTGRDPESGGLR